MNAIAMYKQGTNPLDPRLSARSLSGFARRKHKQCAVKGEIDQRHVKRRVRDQEVGSIEVRCTSAQVLLRRNGVSGSTCPPEIFGMEPIGEGW